MKPRKRNRAFSARMGRLKKMLNPSQTFRHLKRRYLEWRWYFLSFRPPDRSGAGGRKGKKILFIPGPDREKHRAHFKISVLKCRRVHKQDTIQSRQGGPVILSKDQCASSGKPYRGIYLVSQGQRNHSICRIQLDCSSRGILESMSKQDRPSRFVEEKRLNQLWVRHWPDPF